MHEPVLLQEILEILNPRSGGRFIDGTVGGGGHSLGLLEKSAPDGKILAFDRDPNALEFARNRLRHFGERVTFVRASYARMEEIGSRCGFAEVDGILLDLGLSSMQLADDTRGFSFQVEGPLDMRFNPRSEDSAADLVNTLSEEELAMLLYRFGEVEQSQRIARAIIRNRPFRFTSELVKVVEGASTRRFQGRRNSRPVALVFQALRIAVNNELDQLEKGLLAATHLLKAGGRMAIISFHSLEDRLVKHFIRDMSRDCTCAPEVPKCVCDAQPILKPVNKKIIRPSEAEMKKNPRSRSAKLRAAEKLTRDIS